MNYGAVSGQASGWSGEVGAASRVSPWGRNVQYLHGPQDEGTSGVGKAFELAAFLDDALVGGINA